MERFAYLGNHSFADEKAFNKMKQKFPYRQTGAPYLTIEETDTSLPKVINPNTRYAYFRQSLRAANRKSCLVATFISFERYVTRHCDRSLKKIR